MGQGVRISRRTLGWLVGRMPGPERARLARHWRAGAAGDGGTVIIDGRAFAGLVGAVADLEGRRLAQAGGAPGIRPPLPPGPTDAEWDAIEKKMRQAFVCWVAARMVGDLDEGDRCKREFYRILYSFPASRRAIILRAFSDQWRRIRDRMIEGHWMKNLQVPIVDVPDPTPPPDPVPPEWTFGALVPPPGGAARVVVRMPPPPAAAPLTVAPSFAWRGWPSPVVEAPRPYIPDTPYTPVPRRSYPYYRGPGYQPPPEAPSGEFDTAPYYPEPAPGPAPVPGAVPFFSPFGYPAGGMFT